jgi:magnesium-transporting ATPase (P-type)
MSYAPRPDQPWHFWDPNQVIAKLETTEQGLSYAIARKRLREVGRNIFPKDPEPLALFRETCYNAGVWSATLAALVLQWAGELGWAILLAVIVCVSYAVGIKYWIAQLRQKATLARWHRHKPDPTAIVLRDQEWMEISSRLLVPGDFLLVQAGDHPPADVRLLSASPDLCADETMLGNSAIAAKQADSALEIATPPRQRSNMIYAGCQITAGYGTGLVVGTAQNTYWQSQAVKPQFLPRLTTEDLIVGVVAATIGIFALSKGWSYSLLIVTEVLIAYWAIPRALLEELMQYLGIKFLAQQRIEVSDRHVINKLARVNSLELLPSQTAVKLDHRLFSQLKIQLITPEYINLAELQENAAESEPTDEMDDLANDAVPEAAAEPTPPTTPAVAVYGSEIAIADLEYLTSAFLSFSDRRCPIPVQRSVDLVLPRPDLRYLYTAITISRHITERCNRLQLFISTTIIGILILATAGAIASLPLAPLQIIWLGAIASPILCSCFLVEPISGEISKPASSVVQNYLTLAIAVLATSGSSLALFLLKYQGQPEALVSARTMAFTAFFLSQGFHTIAMSRTSILEHWILPLSVAGLAAAQVLLVQSAIFADTIAPLSPADWLIVTFASTSVLWAQEILRQA